MQESNFNSHTLISHCFFVLRCCRSDGGAVGNGVGGGKRGIHVVADAPAERFKAAKALMKARDVADKAAVAALRREKRQEKKAKAKAAMQVCWLRGKGVEGEGAG